MRDERCCRTISLSSYELARKKVTVGSLSRQPSSPNAHTAELEPIRDGSTVLLPFDT
jgi:hypothetical protein